MCRNGIFLEKREGWRIGAVSPLGPLARGQRGQEDNPNGEQVNLSDKRVNLIRILTKQTRKRVNPKTDKATPERGAIIYRISTVYLPYINRVSTVFYSGKKQAGNDKNNAHNRCLCA